MVVPRFRFRRGALEPPGLWVTDQDVLVLRTNALPLTLSAAFTVEARVRMLTPQLRTADYRLSQVIGPLSPSQQTTSVNLTEGFIQGAMVGPAAAEGAGFPGVSDPGAIYAQLTVGLGAPSPFYDHTMLCGGYVTDLSSIGWPGGESQAPLSGPGANHVLQLPAPAAGAEVAPSSLAFGAWRIMAFNVALTTSAVAGNRFVFLRYDTGVGPAGIFGGTFAHNAALTYRYMFAPGLEPGFRGVNQIDVPIPEWLICRGVTVGTLTQGRDAGDQFTAPVVHIRAWA